MKNQDGYKNCFRCGISYLVGGYKFCTVCKNLPGKELRHVPSPFIKKGRELLQEEANKRRAEMMRLRDKGLTLQEIGNMFKLSRQRVEQIIYKPFNSPKGT